MIRKLIPPIAPGTLTRLTVLLLVAPLIMTLTLILALMAGCQSAPSSGSATSPATSRSRYAIEFDSLRVVGYLGLASSAGDNVALEIMTPRLEHALAGGEYPFILMRPEQVAATAGRFGLTSLYRDVLDYWNDSKRVHTLKVQELCEALGFDALLGANIEEWSQVEPTPGSAAPAATRISLMLEIYAAETGRRGWRERVSRTIEAEQAASTTMNTGRQDHGIARVTTAGAKPPRFEEVADEVAAKAADTLAEAAES